MSIACPAANASTNFDGPNMNILMLLVVVATSLRAIEGVTFATQHTLPSPREATVCDLLTEPTAWNHVVVRVTGVATRAFEHFSLSSPTCGDSDGLWLTYGGRVQSETIYCCPGEGEDLARRQPLVVEDVALPLVEDQIFGRFRELLRKQPRAVARVTLVGTFFSGTQSDLAVGCLNPTACSAPGRPTLS
jgi:hypothetical protein